LVGQASKKAAYQPETISAEEFKWLSLPDQHKVRNDRLAGRSQAQIIKANVGFNDRLKLALVDIAKKSDPAKQAQIIKSLSYEFEGVRNPAGGVLPSKQITEDQNYRIDFPYLQVELAKLGLQLGEGELASFAGAELDVVKWSESASQITLPQNTKSPIHASDLSI
jgi:hypothetical protein